MNSIKSIVKNILNESRVNINGNVAVISSYSDGIVDGLSIFSEVESAEQHFMFKIDDFNQAMHLSDNDRDKFLEDGIWEGNGRIVQMFHI